MNNIEKKLRQILQKGIENEVIEFKEAKNQFDSDKLGKYFSALSNEANLKGLSSAWLVFGIKDSDKSFVDTQYGNAARFNSIKNKIANHTTNRITFIEIYELFLHEGRVVIFDIPAAPLGIPIAYKGHYYGRDGESQGALNIEEIERIRHQATKKDWSAQIVLGATISDLSPLAIKRAREVYKIKNPKFATQIDTWNDLSFLNKAKITITNQITNTAILLLGKQESEHFLNPFTSQISWILHNKDNIALDYEHFYCPLLLSIGEVFTKIRNLKYRYIQHGTLFPEEIDRYDPYVIREALNNCIAHQDYTLRRKIVLVENQEGFLIFENAGKFIPKTVEDVVISDTPESRYRNKFLADAMVNLNMIDTIGSGIKKMFTIQKNRFFPLPDYDTSNNQVKVKITGKVIDTAYAQKLAVNNDLSLSDIILLDKVVKKKPLTNTEIKHLRAKKLIEGRKPNFHISTSLAKVTGEEEAYINMKGLDDDHYKALIIEYLKKFKKAKKAKIRDLLDKKLPDILSDKQKDNKIRNLLQKMRTDEVITIDNNRYWILKNLDEI